MPFTILYLLLFSILANAEGLVGDETDAKTLSTPFALVELYTSEGCSSCPPADKLLSQIRRDGMEKGQAIHTLSFHVDYWDYLGWKDPFSDKSYSDRQRKYARTLNTNVYTPMMVVNGQQAFVGSQRETAQTAIRNALKKGNDYTVEFNIKQLNRGKSIVLEARYIGETEKNLVLNAVLAENLISIDVEKGENRGRKLDHNSVVRSFSSGSAEGAGFKELALTIPRELNLSHAEVVVWLQDSESLEVLAAGRQSLEKS